MYTNIPKLKKMPNTKKQPKYLGPYKVERRSGENVIILKTVTGKKTREKRIPIHISSSPIFRARFKSTGA